jgi:hypothetical protein
MMGPTTIAQLNLVKYTAAHRAQGAHVGAHDLVDSKIPEQTT